MSSELPVAGTRPATVSDHPVEGARVRCWTYPAAGTPKSTILMVHGFRGDRHGLARIVDALPGHTVVVPDLPGFGESDPFPALPHSTASYGLVVGALRRELALPQDTVLLGHSFGSIVASHHLATHPGAFTRLVLVNPISEPALQGPKAVMSRIAAGYYALARALPERPGLAVLRSRIVVDTMSAVMSKTKDPEIRAYVFDQHRRYFGGFSNRRMLAEAFNASIGGHVRQVAAAIGAPTLLIAGELDEIGSVASQRSLAALFPDATLRVIPGVGHLVHYETPAEAAGMVEEFLA